MTEHAAEIAALRGEIAALRQESLAAFSEAHRAALLAQNTAHWAMSMVAAIAPDHFRTLLVSQRLLVQNYRNGAQSGPTEMAMRILAVMEEAQASAALLANPQKPGPK